MKTALVFARATHGGSLTLLVAAELALFFRVARRQRQRGLSMADARLYAVFCVLGKVPQALGVLQYAIGRLRGQRSRLIEYKSGVPSAPLLGPQAARKERSGTTG